MFVEHMNRVADKLENPPKERVGTSATDVACAIGILLLTGAFIGWLIVDAVSKVSN